MSTFPILGENTAVVNETEQNAKINKRSMMLKLEGRESLHSKFILCVSLAKIGKTLKVGSVCGVSK